MEKINLDAFKLTRWYWNKEITQAVFELILTNPLIVIKSVLLGDKFKLIE